MTARAFLLGLGAAAASLAASAAAPPVRTLQAVGEAAGGARWRPIVAIAATGREIKDGQNCTVQTLIDVRSGEWRRAVRCPLFTTERGIDAQGPWREDRSGWVHALDSREAARLAATDRWLNRNGPYFPRHWPVALRPAPAVTAHRRRFQRIAATPAQARTVTLWITPHRHRLARTVMRRSFEVRRIDFRDYRRVDGVLLPFRIASRDAPHAAAQIETIERYRLLHSLGATALVRPARPTRDIRIPVAGTHIPITFAADGKVLIRVSINGKAPLPFALDTGGHAILTPTAAQTLGLTVHGRGVTYGAGAGSTAVRYARVRSLGIGAARITGQTVLVMPISPLLTDRGARTPVAGILGLELFERFVVTVDPDHKRLTLQPLGTFRPPTGAAAVPLRFTGDMPLIPARLDGRRGLFGLDTGNSGPLLLFPAWAAREHLRHYYRSGVPQTEGGDGGAFTVHLADIHSLRIGGLAVPGPLIGALTPHDAGVVSNPSEAGNLGMTVWRAFRFTLDYRRERLYLTPRTHYRPPPMPRASGGLIAVKFTPSVFTVLQVSPGGPAARAGLRTGDRIVAVNGLAARRLASLYLMNLINQRRPGTIVALTRGDGRTVQIVLASNAARLRALRPGAR